MLVAQVMIGFEETQYTFRENGDSNTFNVIKRGMNIRDIVVFISPLNYSEFMNMELSEPLSSQRPSSPAECKYLNYVYIMQAEVTIIIMLTGFDPVKKNFFFFQGRIKCAVLTQIWA